MVTLRHVRRDAREFLYHGSTTQGLKTLEPRKRYSPEGVDFEAIYATPERAFAVAHSFPWSTSEGVDLSIYDGEISLHVPHALRERMSAPVSLYKVSSEHFQKTLEEDTGYTWHTTQPASVVEETKYTSVEEALRLLGVPVTFT